MKLNWFFFYIISLIPFLVLQMQIQWFLYLETSWCTMTRMDGPSSLHWKEKVIVQMKINTRYFPFYRLVSPKQIVIWKRAKQKNVAAESRCEKPGEQNQEECLCQISSPQSDPSSDGANCQPRYKNWTFLPSFLGLLSAIPHFYCFYSFLPFCDLCSSRNTINGFSFWGSSFEWEGCRCCCFLYYLLKFCVLLVFADSQFHWTVSLVWINLTLASK